MGQEFVIKDNPRKDSSFGSIAGDFGQSLFHSAVESPINGVTQLVNDVTGTNIKPLVILGAPGESSSSANSWAQKIGGAVGMVVPYILVSKGVGRAATGLAETSMAKSLSITSFLESNVARAGLSGAAYGGVFNPVAADEQNHAWARIRNATVDGATFATLAGSSQLLAKSGIFKPTTSALAVTVRDIGTTMIAGVPAGIVSAEGHSLLGQGRFATASELQQSAVEFVTIGGVLSALTHGAGAAKKSWSSYRNGSESVFTPLSGQQPAVEPVVFKPMNINEIVTRSSVGNPIGSNIGEPVGNGSRVVEPVGYGLIQPVEAAKIAAPKNEAVEPTGVRPVELEPPGAVNPADGKTQLIRIFDESGRLNSVQYPEGSKKLSLGSHDIMLVPGEKFVAIGRANVDINNNNISRQEHAWLGLSADGKVKIAADQQHEVYVKRKSDTNWHEIQSVGTPDGAGFSQIKVHFGDEIRVGRTRASDKGANLDLSSIVKAEFQIGNKEFKLSPGESQTLGREDLVDLSGRVDSKISREHLRVGIDADGRAYIMENPDALSTNGTWINRKGSYSEVKINPGDTVHIYAGDAVRVGRSQIALDGLYAEVGPALPTPPGFLARAKNLLFGQTESAWTPVDSRNTVFRDSRGTLYYREARGEVFESPDGSKLIKNASNATVRERGGRVVEMTDSFGRQYRYSYGKDGSVSEVLFGNGANYKAGNGVELSVDADGTFHWKKGTQEKVFNADGSIESTVDGLPGPGKRFKIENANEVIEKAEILNLAKQQLDVGQLQRFQKHMAEFEARMPDAQERAVTYHEINRLLMETPDSLMSQSERNLIAEQTMWQLANPAVIDQGGRPTCNVTTVEKKTAFEHPSEYARLIADVAQEGKYVTAEGWKVDVADNNVLRADDMALRSINNPFDPINHTDLKDAGKRSWASKIFQETAVETHWSRRTWDDAGNDVGRRWARFADRHGHEALVDFGPGGGKTMLDINAKPLRSPYLHGDYLEDILRQITGAPQTNFYLTKGRVYDPPAASGVESPKATAVEISSQAGKGESDLAGHLLTLLEGRGGQRPQMPIVKVDVAMEPFFTDAGLKARQQVQGGALDASQKPGKHVVIVKSIDVSKAYDPATQTWDPNRVKVEILNSWGREADHVLDPVTGRDNRITLKQLWDAMN